VLNGRKNRVEVRVRALRAINSFVKILQEGDTFARFDLGLPLGPDSRPEVRRERSLLFTRASRRVVGEGAKSGDLNPRAGNLVGQELDWVRFGAGAILHRSRGDEAADGSLQALGGPSTFAKGNQRIKIMIEGEKRRNASRVLERREKKTIEREMLRERESVCRS
jgi:hypothetical protein